MICDRGFIHVAHPYFDQCQEGYRRLMWVTINLQRLESDGIVAFLSRISPRHFINTSRASLLGQ